MASHAQTLARRPATKRSAWSALASHYNKTSKLHLRQLFADDPKRGQRMTIEAVGLYLDYSKNRVCERGLRRCSKAKRSISRKTVQFCT